MSTVQRWAAINRAMQSPYPTKPPLATRLASSFLNTPGVMMCENGEELTTAVRILSALNPGLAQRFQEELLRIVGAMFHRLVVLVL